MGREEETKSLEKGGEWLGERKNEVEELEERGGENKALLLFLISI